VTNQVSKGHLKVKVDSKSSETCQKKLVDYSIEFSTEDIHSNKFWIIISKLPTNTCADCTISISRAGMNNDDGVTRQRFKEHNKPYMFLLEAIVWIFCFGTNLKFCTIEATEYQARMGIFPSFQRFPPHVLGLSRKSGNYHIPIDYSSQFNITHSPIEW
jgi:hypothetical protein